MTKITERLGMRYPIIQGGMQHVSRSPLVIAVSNAGGLGVLTAGSLDAEGLRQEIQTVRENTDQPFGVNLALIQENIEELIDVVVEEKVPVVTTRAGSPKEYIPRFKEAGIKTVPVIASVKHALKMQELGADAVIAEGHAAGGRIGSLSTMPLVRQVVKAVDIPVIAAGGIGDGEGLVAALSLGAEAVQMGTVFLATEECPVPEAFKEKVVEAVDTSTIVTGSKEGRPVRSLRNRLMMRYLHLELAHTPEDELEELTIDSLYRAVVEGDVESGTMMAGEAAGLIKSVRPVKEVIEEMIEDANQQLRNLVQINL